VRTSIRVLAALAGTAVTVTSARADTGSEDAVFGFAAAHVGLSAPLGAVGLEVGLGLSVLRVSVGIGLGLRGVELAALVRTSFPVGHIGRLPLHLSVGLGASRGPGINDLGVGLPGETGPQEIVSFGDDTRWANGELGLELQVTRALAVRVYAGAAVPISTACVVEIDHGPEMPCDGEQRDHLTPVDPFVGAAAAWQFELVR